MVESRVYFDVRTLDDALLKSYVTPQIVAESTKYVEAVAMSYGVLPTDIATPTPFLVERVAMLFIHDSGPKKGNIF